MLWKGYLVYPLVARLLKCWSIGGCLSSPPSPQVFCFLLPFKHQGTHLLKLYPLWFEYIAPINPFTPPPTVPLYTYSDITSAHQTHKIQVEMWALILTYTLCRSIISSSIDMHTSFLLCLIFSWKKKQKM